jgi:Flp pilus assembly protein CpaB
MGHVGCSGDHVKAVLPHGRRNGSASLERTVDGAPTGSGFLPLGTAPAARPSRRRVLGRLLTARVVGGLLVMALAFAGFLTLILTTTPQVGTVVVLTRDLEAGTTLARGDLALVPAQLGEAQSRVAVPAGQVDQAIGRRLAAPAFRNQVLLWPQLAGSDEPALEPDMQAVTVAVRPDTAASGVLRASDWVRVVATTKTAAGRSDSTSRTVIPRARVVAIGRGEQRASAGATGAAGQAGLPAFGARAAQAINTVTLAVPAELVEAVTAAKYSNEIDVIWLGADGGAAPQPTPESEQSGAGR